MFELLTSAKVEDKDIGRKIFQFVGARCPIAQYADLQTTHVADWKHRPIIGGFQAQRDGLTQITLGHSNDPVYRQMIRAKVKGLVSVKELVSKEIPGGTNSVDLAIPVEYGRRQALHRFKYYFESDGLHRMTVLQYLRSADHLLGQATVERYNASDSTDSLMELLELLRSVL